MHPKANDRKVLVIGWDAADWRVIEPMIAEDKMPNLAKFMEDGVHGNISTLSPALSPMLWTSIATGKRPYKHGIHGFSEPMPDGSGVRPITNISRNTKAIWNILNQCEKRSIVVGWWPSHPAEPVDGVMVSNQFQLAGKLIGVDSDAEIGKPRVGQHGWSTSEWPMRPGTVYPNEMAENLQEFRFHPLELEAEHIGPFVPKFNTIDQNKDKRLIGLAKTLADTVSIHGAATALMQLEEWDLMCVYYDGIDHFSHGFMKYHPPRQEWVTEKDFEIYKEVVEGAYRFHDMMLGALVQLAGEDATVIILSDHGFHPDHLRPQSIPVEPAGPAVEHRPYGVFLMKGPGVRKNERIFGASILDLCPTILTLFDLPVGRDMDGKSLVTAFEETPKVDSVDSWDQIDGESGMHPPDAHIDALESAEAIKQLVELGYIEEPNEDQDVAVRETVRELKYNLARSYVDAGLYQEAIPMLETIWEEWPMEHRFGIALMSCYSAVKNVEARALGIRTLAANFVEHQEKAFDTLEEIREEAAKYGIKLPKTKVGEDGKKKLVLESTESEEKEDVSEPPRKLQYKIRKTMSLLHPMDPVFLWLEATQFLLNGNEKKAIPFLKEMAKADSTTPEPYLHVGNAFVQIEDWEEARKAFEQAIELDSENVEANVGIARAAFAMSDWDSAIEHALNATDLVFFNPLAHYVLGRSLAAMGNLEMGRTALNVALTQAPGFTEAHEAMADLLEAGFEDTVGASAHREAARIAAEELDQTAVGTVPDLESIQERINKRRSTRPDARGNAEDWTDVPKEEIVTIVSGLPRSGTSMMMQMLDCGGLAPYTDGTRQADPDNPKGYYEHAKATQLGRDRSWIPDVRGKCVKIMAQLLPMLPSDQKYRVVFMDRDLREIAKSQRVMLDRLGNKGGDLSEASLMMTLDAHVAGVEKWMAHTPNIQCLFIDYADVLGDPSRSAHRINEFLGGSMDEEAMSVAVNPALRRQDMSEG